MNTYRYGKLQKLETREEGQLYIDQVKRGLFIYNLIKMGAFHIKYELMNISRCYLSSPSEQGSTLSI